MTNNQHAEASALLAVMPEGIGDLTFGAPDWVAAAAEALDEAVARHADGLADLGRFTMCEVAHNPPAYLHCGPTLAWHATFDGASVTLAVGELPDAACDYKMQGDHSIISNIARIVYQGSDPALVDAARARLLKLSRWKMHGAMPDHPVLGVVLRAMHDVMAIRTMPRFVFMTPDWVSTARYLLTTRATSEKYSTAIKDDSYTFAEEFIDTPAYAFPDGSHGGFWVRVLHGDITVGAGPLPEEFAPADGLTKGAYTPVVPVGRTVNALMTAEEKSEQVNYSKAAFRFDKQAMKAPVEQSSPSGKGAMSAALGRVFLPLHDELSKRTSGELPADYIPGIKAAWATPQTFDRSVDYDPSWLRYDQVDIYGNPRQAG